ncbi:hypothetical protein ACPOL_5667 [Acidisarcina polymorpha]|uniref:Uncharacterized protein n=1 Tax=Acidisarcina polymorpha TaxID=2211140 RepID=A0A2Z5G6M4_9BACT|nr:hypothetical protein ACPOL_5667 [Acidisarcina polymorpha]
MMMSIGARAAVEVDVVGDIQILSGETHFLDTQRVPDAGLHSRL